VAEKKFVLPNLISINRLFPEFVAPDAITEAYVALVDQCHPATGLERLLECWSSENTVCNADKQTVRSLRRHGQEQNQRIHQKRLIGPWFNKSWWMSANPSRVSAPFSPDSADPPKCSGTRSSTILLPVHAVNSGIYGLIKLGKHGTSCAVLPSLPGSVLFAYICVVGIQPLSL
jgi:hypothetical protein